MEVGQDVDPDQQLVHICESCGLTIVMTSQESYELGWDYPPRMGAFGVLSPRTCGNCGIDTTLWWRLTVDKVQPDSLSEAERTFVLRVNGEPESILPMEVNSG